MRARGPALLAVALFNGCARARACARQIRCPLHATMLPPGAEGARVLEPEALKPFPTLIQRFMVSQGFVEPTPVQVRERVQP